MLLGAISCKIVYVFIVVFIPVFMGSERRGESLSLTGAARVCLSQRGRGCGGTSCLDRASGRTKCVGHLVEVVTVIRREEGQGTVNDCLVKGLRLLSSVINISNTVCPYKYDYNFDDKNYNFNNDGNINNKSDIVIIMIIMMIMMTIMIDLFAKIINHCYIQHDVLIYNAYKYSLECLVSYEHIFAL